MSTWIKHYNHNHDPRNGQFAPLPAGSRQQKKVAKKYKKYAIKGVEEVRKNETSRYVKAFNNSIDYYNDGIRKIREKYESNPDKQEQYDIEISKLETAFDNMVDEKYMEYTIDEFVSNKNLKKAQELVDKYGASNISELAVDNDNILKEYSKKRS